MRSAFSATRTGAFDSPVLAALSAPDPLFLRARALSEDLLRISMLHARLSQIERQALQRCQLGRAQAVILQLLAPKNAADRKSAALSLSALQERLGVSKQSLHSSLSRLLAEGYVERLEPKDRDRRRVVVALSAKGRELEERLLARRLVLLRRAYRALPVQQVEGFRAMLVHLATPSPSPSPNPSPSPSPSPSHGSKETRRKLSPL